MNISSLETFLAIVDTGSLVKASKRLYLTQSTITARLQNLEQELGQTLIVRQKSGVSLTNAGERFRRYAKTMVDLWRQAKQETALPNEVSMVCNIGCDPDLWPALGEPFFNQIRNHFSDAALSVWHGGQALLDSWINSGRTDVSISYMANGLGNHEVYTLGKEQLVLVSTSADSPIRFDPNYVFVEAGAQFSKEHAAAYADADTARINFGSAELGLNHILEYGGSAYLPYRMVARHLNDKRLTILKQAPTFERKVFLIVNKPTAQKMDIKKIAQGIAIKALHD